MKLFIATDIHGSAYFAQQIVDKFYKSGADMLILLGDVYNHGPRNPFPRDYAPMKVAEVFNAIADKVIAVQGNCDSEVDEMISEFPFVNENIVPLNNRRLFLTHGHVHNKDNLPQLAEGDVMIYGHFHRNELTVVNGVYCVNLSSASLPKDKSSYCIVDEQSLAVYDFDGEVVFTQQFNN